MNIANPELKQQAEEEAYSKTEWERRRIDYYRGLRYNFAATTVDAWLDEYYIDREAGCKPTKDPTWNQIRKDAGVGILENMLSLFSEDKKKAIAVKKEQSRRKSQLRVDEANKREREQCKRINNRIKADVSEKFNRFTAYDEQEVEKYFCYALNGDSYSFDGTESVPNFQLLYIAEEKRLVVDYNLPLMEQVSQIKEWKVGKNREIISKEMSKTDYLEMYKRVLLDLSLRAVGILFGSDNRNVLNEIVFNGSCVYSDWQDLPTIILSFLMSKNRYSFGRARRMDCVSKSELAKLKNVRYLGDIHSEKPPADLWDAPPNKLVDPFNPASDRVKKIVKEPRFKYVIRVKIQI